MKKNTPDDEKTKEDLLLSKHLVKGYSAPRKTLRSTTDDENDGRDDDEW